MAWAETLTALRSEVTYPPRARTVAIDTEWVFFAFLVAGLAWVPFWFGSDRLIAWGVNAALFPGLAALYELSLIVRGRPHAVAIQRVRLAGALFAAAAIWVVVQNVAWVPNAWQHPIWQLASEVLGRPITGSISVDRSLTTVALLRLLTAASVFWLALQVSGDGARGRLLLWCVVVIGAVYTAIGIFALGFMSNGRVFAQLSRSRFVTSTFVNQNHYATFAGIGFIAAAGLALRIYRRQMGRSGHLLRLKIAALIDATGKAALPLALGSVILTGLLLSGTRGGIIATGLGFLALLTLSMCRGERGSRSNLKHEALLFVIAALVVGVAFVGFGDVFVGRIERSGVFEQGRLQLFILTISSILTAPLLGFGYGTFSVAFSMFHDQSVNVWVFWDKAHNTYLETFQGLGLFFGAMLIASVVVLVWDCLRGARTRRRDATIPAIAASASLLVGAHALVDFSLQIQAVTLTYMAILGAGVAQARDRFADSTSEQARRLSIR
jgi:O-antigen ligase